MWWGSNFGPCDGSFFPQLTLHRFAGFCNLFNKREMHRRGKFYLPDSVLFSLILLCECSIGFSSQIDLWQNYKIFLITSSKCWIFSFISLFIHLLFLLKSSFLGFTFSILLLLYPLLFFLLKHYWMQYEWWDERPPGFDWLKRNLGIRYWIITWRFSKINLY